MSDSERKLSNHVSSGFVDGTGAEIEVVCGFKPKSVVVWNADGLVRAHWNDIMDSDSMIKVVDASVAGTVVITPHADSAGTPAGSNDKPAITVTPHADSAGTPSEATPATVSNAVSVVTNQVSAITPGFHASIDGVTKGTPALTHNADPVGNLAANPLFVVEGYGVGNKNIGVLQSNCNSTTSVLGSVDDASGMCGASTPRFWVSHNLTPDGVAVYVDEADSDKLVFISPSESDCVVMMPFEAIADGIPGFSYAVTIHHKASMAGCAALGFDDDGAADAQLCFIDTGTTGGVILADDIEVVAPSCMSIVSDCGQAAAQVGEAAAQVATVTPGTYDALATHDHASTAALDSAPVFSGSALAAHSHASTAAFTGTGGGMSVVTSDGIIPMFNGFKIGADTDLNVSDEDLYWVAIK